MIKLLIGNLFSKFFGSNNISVSSSVINSKLLGNNLIAPKAYLENSELGDLSYIGRSSYIISSKIGKYCSIGSFVTTAIGAHPVGFLVNHPSFYSKGRYLPWKSNKQFDFQELIEQDFQIHIGNFVWIGQNTIILGGVSIGDGAIIAAGSVVIKNIPSYEVWGGNPIKKIKNRFNENEMMDARRINWDKIDKKEISDAISEFPNSNNIIKKFLS
jgi:acetyltransferase-like isoleucine patch superfamily enzyme